MVPGIPVLIYFVRRARRRLGLARKERVSRPKVGGLWEELAGPLAYGFILVLWPLALVGRERVTDYLVANPWLVARTW